MKERNFFIIGILIASFITSLSFSQDCSLPACLSIQNVNSEEKTLDIYMTNTVVVGGFNFFIKGVIIETITDGSSSGLDGVIFNSNADCDADGELDTGCNLIYGYSFNPSNTIPIGTDVLLLSASFTDYNEAEICFDGIEDIPDGDAGWSRAIISDADGESINTEWGPCWCGTAGVDCLGVCGGNAILTDCGCGEVASDGVTGCCFDGLGPNDEAPDCANVCGGTAVEDACGTCEGNITDATECECPVSGEVRDCAGVCDGPGVEDCAGECDGPGVENSAGDGACCASGVIDCNNICDGPGVENSAGDGACCALGVIDCNNICDGSGVEDCAGVCDGTAVEDCAGVCGGDAEKDACNACEGTDQFTCDDGSSCVPFDGTCDNECSLPNGDCSCSGQEFDECNLCGGPGVILPSCDCEYNLFDCADVCDGPGEYLSDGITCCSTGRIDNADTCCDSELILDCAGICNGTSLLDCAGVCGGDSVLSGCDNTCNSTAVEDCADVCDNDPTNDCPECDCAGECGGDDISCLAINELIIPEENSIHNIYPNPFNPITRISYQLPRNSDIQITVYDLNGTEVTTLLNTFQIAGYHTLTWNASSYPSGIYLIRMDSGKFTQTKKVLLVK